MHDDPGGRSGPNQFVEDLEPVTVFKPQIQQQDVDRFGVDPLDRRGAGCDMPDQLERTLHADELTQNDDEIQIVVGDQDAAAARRRSHKGLGCTVENLGS